MFFKFILMIVHKKAIIFVVFMTTYNLLIKKKDPVCWELKIPGFVPTGVIYQE